MQENKVVDKTGKDLPESNFKFFKISSMLTHEYFTAFFVKLEAAKCRNVKSSSSVS